MSELVPDFESFMAIDPTAVALPPTYTVTVTFDREISQGDLDP